MKTALIIYANGGEDTEATAAADVLVRGGAKVIHAALNDDGGCEIKLAQGTRVLCDCNLNDCKEKYDLIVIPGGLPGATHCRESKVLTAMLKNQQEEGRLIGAICASPGMVLAAQGFITTQRATGYPGTTEGIKNLSAKGVEVSDDGLLITGKGPAFAIDFGLALLRALLGTATADKVAAGMLCK